MWPDSSLQLFERPSGYAFTASIQQSESHVLGFTKISEGNNNPLPWWWFQMFFIFTPTWGNDQIWPSYGWFNHQLVVRFPSAISSWSKFARKPKLREELEEKVKAQHEQNHPKSTKLFSFIFGVGPSSQFLVTTQDFLTWTYSETRSSICHLPWERLVDKRTEGLGREAVAVHGANSIYRHPMEFRRLFWGDSWKEPGKSTEIEFLPGFWLKNLLVCC